jgi:hypothetical protein
MQVQQINNMFNFTFEKTADEVVAATTKKTKNIRDKIEERGVRIKKLREEHKITDAVLIDIQNQMRAQQKLGERERMSYTSNAVSSGGGVQEEVTIGAGVINHLLTEQDYIDGEKAQVERLDVMARNLREVVRRTANGTVYTELFKLSYEELKYLGF